MPNWRGAAVAIHVRAGHGGTERVAGRRAGERVQQRAGPPRVEVRVALRVAVLARGAAEDVVLAVAVDVAGVGDRVAVLIAGLAGEAVDDPPGPARLHPRPARVVRARQARLAGEHLVGAVAVDVLERRDAPCVVAARVARVLPEDLHPFLEAGVRGRGDRERQRGREGRSALDHAAVLRPAARLRFHEIAQLRGRRAEGGAEAVGEVRRAAVAEVGGDPRQRLLAQALHRLAQPQVVQVLRERAAGALVEDAREMERRDVQLVRELAERERLGEPGEQQVLGRLDELGALAARGRAGARRRRRPASRRASRKLRASARPSGAAGRSRSAGAMNRQTSPRASRSVRS